MFRGSPRASFLLVSTRQSKAEMKDKMPDKVSHALEARGVAYLALITFENGGGVCWPGLKLNTAKDDPYRSPA